MIDLALLAVLGVVTWLVSNDGAWSAGITFLCTLIAGLLAMNFFEPLALLLSAFQRDWDTHWDMIALLGLFIGGVFGLRAITEYLAPTYIQVPGWVDNVGRWGFALGTGYVTMAFLLTALHTAPLPTGFLGFLPQRANLLGAIAPDRQWLGFVQYVTERPFSRRDLILGGLPGQIPHMFDGTYQVVGDPGNPYKNAVWPSFPIRYATRRDMFAGKLAAAPVGPAPAPGPAAAAPGGNNAPITRPPPAAGGGGAGNSGF